jgi:tetratricopeptide (TPR) repeat protein
MDKKKDDVHIEIEDKDPVWLKDKGDHFYKRSDYQSAANAYSKALEFDKEFLMGRINRATTWLKVRAFTHCIEDCNDIETQILALKESEREDEFYQKMLARMHVKRGAAYCWVSLFDKSIEDLRKATAYKGIFSELEIYELNQDIQRIQIREQSQASKQEGDLSFFDSNLDQAFEMYSKALELDSSNEYAYANMGLIMLKRQDYQKCVDYSTKALDIIDSFMNETRTFSRDNRLEVKILLRRGKSYETLQQFEKAKDDLDRAVSLEPQNGEAKNLLKKVQEKLDSILFDSLNKQATDYQKV